MLSSSLFYEAYNGCTKVLNKNRFIGSESVVVSIPRGVKNEEKIKVNGEEVLVKVLPHESMWRVGDDLYIYYDPNRTDLLVYHPKGERLRIKEFESDTLEIEPKEIGDCRGFGTTGKLIISKVNQAVSKDLEEHVYDLVESYEWFVKSITPFISGLTKVRKVIEKEENEKVIKLLLDDLEVLETLFGSLSKTEYFSNNSVDSDVSEIESKIKNCKARLNSIQSAMKNEKASEIKTQLSEYLKDEGNIFQGFIGVFKKINDGKVGTPPQNNQQIDNKSTQDDNATEQMKFQKKYKYLFQVSDLESQLKVLIEMINQVINKGSSEELETLKRSIEERKSELDKLKEKAVGLDEKETSQFEMDLEEFEKRFENGQYITKIIEHNNKKNKSSNGDNQEKEHTKTVKTNDSEQKNPKKEQTEGDIKVDKTNNPEQKNQEKEHKEIDTPKDSDQKNQEKEHVEIDMPEDSKQKKGKKSKKESSSCCAIV
ncbi:hypothetical protein QTN25_002142 [Entamoeba marina]